MKAWLKRLEAKADKASAAGFIAAIAMLGGVAAYGATVSGRIEPLRAEIAELLDRAAFEAGFKIEGLSLSGMKNAPSQDVLGALKLPYPKSIMAYDTEEARKRLLEIGWIEKAEVRRIFPSRLEVSLAERKPFARYASGDKIYVINEKGVLLGESRNAAFLRLLLVEGEGAPQEAASLDEAFAGFEDLKAKVERAELVADRFWELRLDTGLKVKLPRKVSALALERLQMLLANNKIAAMDLESIDLRLPHRTVLSLKDATLANRDKAMAQLVPGYQAALRVPAGPAPSIAPKGALIKAASP